MGCVCQADRAPEPRRVEPARLAWYCLVYLVFATIAAPSAEHDGPALRGEKPVAAPSPLLAPVMATTFPPMLSPITDSL